MKGTDKTLDVLQLLAGLPGREAKASGLRVVTVKTADPSPVTLVMAGIDRALDVDLFEIPVSCFPLIEGDTLLVYPITGGAGSRWGVVSKLQDSLCLATMKSGTAAQPDGSSTAYTVQLPYGMSLTAGDRVAIAPTWSSGQINYVVLNRY